MSEIRVNKVIDEAGTGAVGLTQGATLPSGKTISGAGSISIDGNISIGGTLTYEDVTNIDSVGLITAGIHVTLVIQYYCREGKCGILCWWYFNT